MEGAVLGEQDHAAVLAFGRDPIAEAIREALRERPDGGVARDVLRLKPEPALADEAVSLALDEHRLPESVVQRGLPREAECDCRRVPCFEEPLAAHVRIAFEPRQQLALSANRFVDDERRVVRRQERIRSPFLRPPTELARQIARVHGGRHLEAAVTLDSVERLLVAPDAFREARFRPVAKFDATVLADDPIALALEDLLLLRLH